MSIKGEKKDDKSGWEEENVVHVVTELQMENNPCGIECKAAGLL